MQYQGPQGAIGTETWRQAQIAALRGAGQGEAASPRGEVYLGSPYSTGDWTHDSGPPYPDIDSVSPQAHPPPPLDMPYAYGAPFGPAVPMGVAVLASEAYSRGGAGAPPGAPPAASATGKPPRGNCLTEWLVPDGSHRYWALWTGLITLVMAFLFAFMAGQYDLYHIQSGSDSSAQTSPVWGPNSLWPWLSFWSSNPAYSFDFSYLLAWGGRYAPAIAEGEWWRIFSSLIVHASFAHLLTNCVVLVALAAPLEHVYGPLRIAFIFVASGLAGTFLSAAFEDACNMYVGASGAVMGFVGLYVADVLLNWESRTLPLVRLLIMLVAIAFMLVLEYVVMPITQGVSNVSHLSHVGGLVGGLVVSFLFLPNFAHQRWSVARRAARRRSRAAGASAAAAELAAAAEEAPMSCWRRHCWAYFLVGGLCVAVVLFLFAGLPVYLWVWMFPDLVCPTAR